MIAKLIVEGKEFPIEIQDPELQKLLVPPKKTGYERVDISDNFFWEHSGGIIWETESRHYNDNRLYETANYYSDQTVAENNARADKLMRQLRRFAVEHREKKIDWSKELLPKYFIRYGHDGTSLFIDCGYAAEIFGCIYFDTQEAAQAALDTFHHELIWYFTEYKDSL